MNYVGHLAFGLEAYKHLKKYIKNKNEFITACVAPDIAIPDSITKSIGHYRDKSTHFLGTPDIDRFLEKYRNRLNEDFVLGYFCHLYADFVFCSVYMMYAINPLDKNKKLYNKRDASFVYLKKQDKIVTAEEYKTNYSIYTDYTISNDTLIKLFKVPTKLTFTLNNPHIDEIDSNKLKDILPEVNKFLTSGDFKDKQTDIILVDEYCKFIKIYAEEFSKLYINLISKKSM